MRTASQEMPISSHSVFNSARRCASWRAARIQERLPCQASSDGPVEEHRLHGRARNRARARQAVHIRPRPAPLRQNETVAYIAGEHGEVVHAGDAGETLHEVARERLAGPPAISDSLPLCSNRSRTLGDSSPLSGAIAWSLAARARSIGDVEHTTNRLLPRASQLAYARGALERYPPPYSMLNSDLFRDQPVIPIVRARGPPAANDHGPRVVPALSLPAPGPIDRDAVFLDRAERVRASVHVSWRSGGSFPTRVESCPTDCRSLSKTSIGTRTGHVHTSR